MIPVRLSDLPVDRMPGEAAAAFFFSDERPLSGAAALLDWRLNGLLTELLRQGRAIGEFGEHVLIRSNGKIATNWVLFVGGGKRCGLGADGLRWLVRHLLETCRRAGIARIALGLDLPEGVDSAALPVLVDGVRADLDAAALDCQLARPVVVGQSQLP